MNINRIILAGILWASCLSQTGWAQAPQTPPNSTAPPLFKGGERKDTDPNGRTVEGTVKNDDDEPIEGAIVKLKDMKSLNVRSFITKADGKYKFSSLRKDVDYELKADLRGSIGAPKMLSIFDSRKQAIINLKLEPAPKDSEKKDAEKK
ncbi:MAG: carboxypeptidase-like regulatory domain-containing protein [Acidobacteria bacterium]|nr:carboxypeptidase-like regulatory domain-containing protein [Acidobacteriota bacterium]